LADRSVIEAASMGVSTKSRCTTHSFQPTSHTLGVTGRGGGAPARCPRPSPSLWPRRARIAESLLGRPSSPRSPAPSPLASFAAHPWAHVGAKPLLPPPATSRWRDADSAPARRRSQDTVPPAVQPAYVVTARRHRLGICGHLVRSAQGKPRNRDRAAAGQTGIDGADPFA
jgi:hypothetical protein